MNILDLDDAFPEPEFISREASKWLGKKLYIKRMQRYGTVVKLQRNKVGYGLLIDCNGFFLHLRKPQFPIWVELKPGDIELPVMH